MKVSKINKILETFLEPEKELTCYKDYDNSIYDTITYEDGQIILETEEGTNNLGNCEKGDFYMSVLDILSEKDLLKQYEIIIDTDDIVIYESGTRYY